MPNDKLTVMVVEDEELLLQIIQQKLTEIGINIIPCPSGEEALKQLKENKLPDAIWLDYHLRGMDGLEFIFETKKDPKICNVPILVVSNSANDETMGKLLSAGAAKYLLKAENRLDDIIKEIKNLLNIPTI